MSGYSAHGYDIVLEVSETAVSFVVGAELVGLLTEHSGDLSEYDFSGFSGIFNFAVPGDLGAVSLDAPGVDTATLDIPFFFSATLDPSSGRPDPSLEVRGHVEVIAGVFVRDVTETTVYPAFNFRSLDRHTVVIVEHDPLADVWQPHEGEVINLVERVILDGLRDLQWHDVDSFEIEIDPANDGRDPFTPVQVDVRVIRGDTTGSIALLMTTRPEAESEGDRDAFTSSALDPTGTAVVIVGNELLLRRVIGRTLLNGLGLLDPEALVPMAELYGLLEYADNRVDLVEPVDLRHLIDEWWAPKVALRHMTIRVLDDETIDVSAEILAGGPLVQACCQLHMTAELEVGGGGHDVILHWHLDTPAVDIVAGPLTWLGFGVLALIARAFSGLAGDFVFAALEDPLTSEFEDSETSEEPACTLVGREEWPSEAEPVDIDCPFNVPGIPWAFIDDVILDDMAIVGTLDVPDLTIEWPPPRLEIVGDWRVSDGEFGEGHAVYPIRGVTGLCFTHYKEHGGDFRAIPIGPVVHPIDYAWCIGGDSLAGEGTVTVGDTSVAYTVNGNHCELTVEAGGSLDTELCVSAVDATGVELFARRATSVTGREQFCHFEGVERIQGPPPELHHPGAYVAEQAFAAGPFRASAGEVISRGDYEVMIRAAFTRGMGVDPAASSVRRPSKG